MDQMLIGAGLVTAISLFLALTMLGSLVRGLAQQRRFVRVEGTVVDVREQADTTIETAGTAPAYAPVLAFRTVDGRDVQTESSRWSNRYAGSTGKRVSVLYDPKDPTEAYIGSLGGTPVFVYLIGFVIAAGVCAVGAVVLLNRLG